MFGHLYANLQSVQVEISEVEHRGGHVGCHLEF